MAQIGIPGGEVITPVPPAQRQYRTEPTYDTWKQNVAGYTADWSALQAAIMANTGKSVDEITDQDMTDAILNDMFRKTNASRVLTPMWERYLRSQSANMAGSYNLKNLSQNRGGTTPTGPADLTSFVKNAVQTTGASAPGYISPETARQYLADVSAIAVGRGSPTGEGPTYEALRGNPALQRQMANAALNSLGYGGMWANYLGQQLNQAYTDWLYTPEGERPPTFTEYVYGQLHPVGLWY